MKQTKILIKGGYKTVATIDDRDNLPEELKENLMLIAVEADSTIYQLVDGDWIEFELGVKIDDTTATTGTTYSSEKIENTVKGINIGNGTGVGSITQKISTSNYSHTTVGKVEFTNGSATVLAKEGLDLTTLGTFYNYFFNQDNTVCYYLRLKNLTPTSATINDFYVKSKIDDTKGWFTDNLTGSTVETVFSGVTGDYFYERTYTYWDFTGVENGATGLFSSATGFNTLASGNYSSSEGFGTKATGQSSHAEGKNTEASSYSSHAEGLNTVASADNSHAEGSGTVASGVNSHAEGQNTVASGFISHAEGFATTASGQNSHAEGFVTTASGLYSHTEGTYTIGSGQASHAGGNGYTTGKEVIASGKAAFNHSEVTNVTGVSGASAANSAILGGINHSITSGATGAAIIGGSGITATLPNTVYVPELVVVNGIIKDVNGNSVGTQINDSVSSTGSTYSSEKIENYVDEAQQLKLNPSSYSFYQDYYKQGKIRVTNGSNLVLPLDGLNMLDDSEEGINYWWQVAFFINDTKTQIHLLKFENVTATGATIQLNQQFLLTINNPALGWVSGNVTSQLLPATPYAGVTGDYKFFIAEDQINSATGNRSIALGRGANALGTLSVAIGEVAQASGKYSFAAGYHPKATGEASVSLGGTASGYNSFSAIGGTASGDNSHAVGGYTIASGNGSHASGKGLWSNRDVKASGIASFNHSEVTTTGVSGATAANSAILGGINHTITSGATKSVIIGGQSITATKANTVYVPAVEVANGDLEFSTLTGGVVIKSPNGTRFRISVDNDGRLQTEAII